MKLTRWYYSVPSIYEVLFLLPPHLLWHRRAISLIVDEVSGMECDAGSILEIGSGTGRLSRMLAKRLWGKSVYSIDSSPAMVAHASSRSRLRNLRFLNLDFFDLPRAALAREGFEVVVSLNAWCFFPLDESVKVLRDVSREGTKFVAVTYAGSPWSYLHSRVLSSLLRVPLYCHRPGQFVEVLGRYGFRATYRWINRMEGSYIVKGQLAE